MRRRSDPLGRSRERQKLKFYSRFGYAADWVYARRRGCGKHISISALERGQIVQDRSGRVKFKILNQREIAFEPASFGI